jgi:hypothetical protein
VGKIEEVSKNVKRQKRITKYTIFFSISLFRILKNIMFVSPKLFLAISLVFASSPPPAAAASEKVTLNFYGEAL